MEATSTTPKSDAISINALYRNPGRSLQLQRGPEDAQAVLVELDKLATGRYQKRVITPDRVRQLAETIRQNGLLQPVTARQVGDGIELIAGHRRRDAFKLLRDEAKTDEERAKWERIPCIIRLGLSEVQAAALAAVENLERDDGDPLEQGLSLLEVKKAGGFTNNAQVAGATGMNVQRITRLLRLAESPPVIQAAVTPGLLSPAAPPASHEDHRCIVKERDRELIALLAITRYLTTAQANALFWPGRHDSVGRRRLFVLAGLAPRHQPNRVRRTPPLPVCSPPYLRRLQFQNTAGHRVDVWALTTHGYALAHQVLGQERKVHREDVSAMFLEHWAVLTDLFVGLASPLLSRGVKVRDLLFRWDPSDSNYLPWKEYDAGNNVLRPRVIVPDAVLEFPGQRQRYFVECEMGTHSIASTSDEKAGATLRKTERYDELFGGYADAASKTTFYAQSFPDGWPAEVLYLVRKESRRDSVNAALARWRTGRAGVAVQARAITVDEAIRELGPHLGGGVSTSGQSSDIHLTSSDVELLREFYQQALVQLGATTRELPEKLRATALRARAVLQRTSRPSSSSTR